MRRLAYEASDNGLLSPDLAASIRRVKGTKKLELGSETGLPALKGAGFLRPLIDAKRKAKEIMPSWPSCWAVASGVPS